MITIISGVPGAGKTALLVEMMMDELKQGRKIFTIGIPRLLLNVLEGGDAHTWQDGTWLKIDQYNPQLTKAKGIKAEWFPRGCKSDCQFLSTCPRIGTERPDAGALLIIDEAHTHFPQRSSGKAPPSYVEALTVHRHQGLDIWFVSQRPSFLDPFVRGLSSRHIHLGLNPFSFSGSRNKYEWSEYQETVNRTSKALAAKSSYKPSPAVFPLYASATVHTKLDQRMPTIQKMFLIALTVLVVIAAFAVNRVRTRINDLNKTQSASVAAGMVVPSVLPHLITAASGVIPAAVVSPVIVAAVPVVSKPVDRPISVLKLAHGVYSDLPADEQHYTSEQLEAQVRNAHIIEKNIRVVLSENVEVHQPIRYVTQEEMRAIPAIFH